jgi:hypothetical protein
VRHAPPHFAERCLQAAKSATRATWLPGFLIAAANLFVFSTMSTAAASATATAGTAAAPASSPALAQFDLTFRVAPYLDRHLVLPLLEHVQKIKVGLSLESLCFVRA